jgi:putative Mg2+ transporter-C (MgtC) family protein
VDFDIYIRVLAALALGFIIGYERECANKYAGLRTNILVCLGACIFTAISIYGFPMIMGEPAVNGAVRDTARGAHILLRGLGLSAGGTVLRHGTSVHGLTTAVTLWVSASECTALPLFN